MSARAPQSKAKKGKPITAKGTKPKPKPKPKPAKGTKPKSKGKSSPKGKTPQAKVPSIAEILKKLNLPKDKIIFYSGPTHKNVDAWNLKRGNIYRALTADTRIWKDRKYVAAMTGPGSPLSAAQEQQFWENASKALAQGASGVVHVMLPSNTKGRKWIKGSVWDRIEWPALIKNRKVTKIIRINPGNDTQEVIWGQ